MYALPECWTHSMCLMVINIRRGHRRCFMAFSLFMMEDSTTSLKVGEGVCSHTIVWCYSRATYFLDINTLSVSTREHASCPLEPLHGISVASWQWDSGMEYYSKYGPFRMFWAAHFKLTNLLCNERRPWVAQQGMGRPNSGPLRTPRFREAIDMMEIKSLAFLVQIHPILRRLVSRVWLVLILVQVLFRRGRRMHLLFQATMVDIPVGVHRVSCSNFLMHCIKVWKTTRFMSACVFLFCHLKPHDAVRKAGTSGRYSRWLEEACSMIKMFRVCFERWDGGQNE